MGSRPRGGSNATKDGSVEARSSATAGRDRTLRSSAFAAERSPRGSRRPCRSARRTVSHTVISGTLSSFRAAASACGLFLARLHVDASASRAGTSLGGDPGAPAEAVGVAGRRSAGTSAHPSLGVRLRTRRAQAVLVGDGGGRPGGRPVRCYSASPGHLEQDRSRRTRRDSCDRTSSPSAA